MKHHPDVTKPFAAVLTFREAVRVLMTASSMGREHIKMKYREDVHSRRQEGSAYIVHNLPSALH